MKLGKAFWFAILALAVWAAPCAAQPASTTTKSTTEASPASEQPAAAEASASTTPSEEGGGKPATTSAAAPTETPATKPATSSAEAAGQAPVDGATYAVRLRDLESRVDELKEQVRRSHTRLSLLSDTILSGGVGGARAEITFKNEMSSAFRMTRALFVLDGAVQYNKQDDTGALAGQDEIPIFSGSIPPGDHTLQVLVQLRGHGYGVFSYLRGYKFEVKSSHSFTITEGKTIQLEAVAWEKGGVTTPLEQRPALRYVEKIRSGAATASEPAKPSGSSDAKAGASTSFSVGTGTK